MIYTFFYYTLFSSAVLLYGVGLNRSTLISDFRSIIATLFKVFASIFFTSILSWLFVSHILMPLKLIELYPFVVLLIYLIISVFLETIVRITAKVVTSEFSVSYLIALLALNESTNLVDVMVISASCLFSFILLIPIIKVINKRIVLVGDMAVHGNYRSLLLISVAIIVVALACGNVSWLNPGVLK